MGFNIDAYMGHQKRFSMNFLLHLWHKEGEYSYRTFVMFESKAIKLIVLSTVYLVERCHEIFNKL